jgi:hypothetical protein
MRWNHGRVETQVRTDWEQVLSAAARLPSLLPEAVLVGGTASALHAGHRFSRDADHVLPGLREHFDAILAQLESVAGWKTARVQRPVQVLGSLDGIETGIRQLIREQPLETTVINHGSLAITVPTKEVVSKFVDSCYWTTSVPTPASVKISSRTL